MTFAAITLIGMTMGQPPGPDYFPMNSRTIKLPIEYKKDRKTIRNVLLFVARNGENTWYQESIVTPDKDHFVYVAKDDGVYWFKMVIEDLKGNRDPADLTRDPPDLKMVIDTTQPQIRVTNARRTGEEIVIEWQVEDKFPNDAETKVHFRPTADTRGEWKEVRLPADSRTGVRFPSGTTQAVSVKISTVDIAGNRGEITQDYPAAGTSTSLKESPTDPIIAPGPDGKGHGLDALPIHHKPPAIPEHVPGVVPPPDLTPPVGPGPLPPVGPAPYVPPVTNPQLPAVTQQPLATVDPNMQSKEHSPVGAWNGVAQPAAELPRPQVINFARFDLGFELEKLGPSGISRVELWVTRDDGRTWTKWSNHDGKGGSVNVVLDIRENTQLEGSYGFRLVPVSGALLSEREPAAGDAPDMRVVLDVTPPQLELYRPKSDPKAPDTLILQWKATDRNFEDQPITLEWSESATGPWKPVAATESAPVVQVTAADVPVVRKLPNTGEYAWRLPASVPARVYLKATARDAAGNVREVVTREPILVDLTKPRAKINGIVPPTPRP